MSTAPIKSIYYPKFVAKIPSQEGKVVVITGTTTGTGYVAARTMLKKGATVVMLNRESPRVDTATEQMLNELESDSNSKADMEKRLVNIACDLQSFASVRDAAAKVIELFPNGINILCNNAGIGGMPDFITADGFEIQMQTNHLSHFLLSNLLFKSLIKGQEFSQERSRIVMHSSSLRLLPFTTLKAKFMQKQKGPGHLGGDGTGILGPTENRYHQTKLANSVFTLELAKRIAKEKLLSKVIIVAAHPGWAETNGTKQEHFADDTIAFFSKFGTPQSAEDGALGIIHCMVNKVGNGKLYGPRARKGLPTERYHGWPSVMSSGKMLMELSELATDCSWSEML